MDHRSPLWVCLPCARAHVFESSLEDGILLTEKFVRFLDLLLGQIFSNRYSYKRIFMTANTTTRFGWDASEILVIQILART